MLILRTHQQVALRNDRLIVEAGYTPGDRGAGWLTLMMEEQRSFDMREVMLRLDPWVADEYFLFDWSAADALVICGAQGVCVVSSAAASLSSFVWLEFEEGERLDHPWAITTSKHMVVATERRAWCYDLCGKVRWIWSTSSHAPHLAITEAPKTSADMVTLVCTHNVRIEISLQDGSLVNQP